MSFKPLLLILFFNITISVAIKVFDLKFPVCVLKVLLKRSRSQGFDLGLSFYHIL